MNPYLEDYFFVVIIGIIAVVITLVLSILVLTKIMPKDKKDKLPRFFKFLAGIFNFDSLLIEKIFKFLYIFCTIFCVIFGFLLCFWIQTEDSIRWAGYMGPVVLIAGPIILRLFYELFMLFILLVKDTHEINKKLSEKTTFENQ